MSRSFTEAAFAPSTPLTLRPLLYARPLRTTINERPKRLRSSTPTMLIEQLKSLSDAFFKQFNSGAAAQPTPSTQSGAPLVGDRSVVLVTGATGKTGYQVVRKLLESGAATKILAHVSSRAEEIPEWDETKVTVVQSDLAKPESITELVTTAKEANVGSVVFAASGGPDGALDVDNLGVARLGETFSNVYESDMPSLFKFPASISSFGPLDDVIMGGRSDSTMTSSEDGYATFKGNVTTAGGGGFAQTRALTSGSPMSGEGSTVDLSKFDGVQLRVRGDGRERTYKINLKDDDVPDFAFQSLFNVSSDTWQTIRLPFDSFIPMKRGKPQFAEGPSNGSMYARTIDLTRVSAFGIVLSLVANDVKIANVREREGPFALDVSNVSVYKNEPPRFVLVSSAAVTRPFWDAAEKQRKGEEVTQIPIVQLNPGQLLGHKLAGENRLRASGVNYCIVRPIGLNDTVDDGRKILIGQGDTLSGRVNRADVAQVVVAALRSNDTAYKTFEVGADLEQVGADVAPEEFQGLQVDPTEESYATGVQEMLANPPEPAAVS